SRGQRRRFLKLSAIRAYCGCLARDRFSASQIFRHVFSEYFQGKRNDTRIEVGSSATTYFFGSFIEINRSVVGTLVDHRVDSIDYCKDSRPQGNRLAAQAAWIAGAVELFVVAQHKLGRLAEKLEIAEKFVPILGMLSHHRPLAVVEARRFPKNAV